MTNVVILNGIIKGLYPGRTNYLGHKAAQLTVETRPEIVQKLPGKRQIKRHQILSGVEVHQVLCLDDLAEKARNLSGEGYPITIQGELHYIEDDTSQPVSKKPFIIASQISILKRN